MKQALVVLAPALLLAAAADLQLNMQSRVDAGKSKGIVAGVVTADGQRVMSVGSSGGSRALDGDTIFEIGSITKVFTSLLLADMVERGEVTLDTPVQKLLPAGVTVPSDEGREITLLDLSTQVSGLPRLPHNLRPKTISNPYADYDAPKLYEFLNGYKLPRKPGEKYEYSNLAVGLLGHALALKAGMSYEALLKQRICGPLGMKDTTITLSEGQKARLAPGFDEQLRASANWDLASLEGAGAIRSSVNDMMKFLAAAMEMKDTPLKAAFRRMRSVRRSTGRENVDIEMAWHVFTQYGTEIVWHNGGTGGYRSFMGFVPATRKGIVVLSNSAFEVDEIGRHELEPQWAVKAYPAKPAVP